MSAATPTPENATPQALRVRIERDFARSGLMLHLGAHLGDVAPGRVHIHLPFSASVTQHLGLFHAGATSAIADAAGGWSALTLQPPGHTVLTVEFKINLLAPAQGESLEAVGRVVRSGRTLTVCQVDVFALQAGEKAAIALMQQTIIAVPERQS
ncbi:PaaI family thioesterase [Castellaniella sp.]|uniref:PaaI family thioesterase n=1 Tax=Castellaniella sp. TaxID=1955812 RepID=UPI003566AA9B